jgi:ADP-ribose pyrophosphatase YjhB (NUDIX family)
MQKNNLWSLPKGHIEEGEDTLAAAKREIAEESGVTELEYIRELGVYTRYKLNKEGHDDTSELKTIHVFLFKTTQEKLQPIDPDNPEARWVAKEDVVDMLPHKKDKEFFLEIINKGILD